MGESLLSIGDAARRFGVAVSALRYYDRLGLLEPAERRGNGRHYGREQLERIALIQLLQGGALTLEEIAELIAGPSNGRTWREVLDERVRALDEQIAQAEAAREVLRHFRECPSDYPVEECAVLAGMLDERVERALAA